MVLNPTITIKIKIWMRVWDIFLKGWHFSKLLPKWTSNESKMNDKTIRPDFARMPSKENRHILTLPSPNINWIPHTMGRNLPQHGNALQRKAIPKKPSCLRQLSQGINQYNI